MEAAGCYESLVPLCQTMWHRHLEDHNLKVTDGTFLVHPDIGGQFHFNILFQGQHSLCMCFLDITSFIVATNICKILGSITWSISWACV